ncbi:MAG TPA: FIST C-terminal domain-containing protein, partial [Stellaceae bacterium]
ALDVLEERLGRDRWSERPLELSLAVTLGQKQGDPFARYDENAYVNRLILTVDRERRSVMLFEPDFHAGSQVQIMSRDNSLMLASVRDGTASLVARTADRDTLLWLYFDCAGRASARSGAEIEEAGVLVAGLPGASPLLGFYSGVEVAPVAGGPSRSLDWTGVLTSLYRRPAAP